MPDNANAHVLPHDTRLADASSPNASNGADQVPGILAQLAAAGDDAANRNVALEQVLALVCRPVQRFVRGRALRLGRHEDFVEEVTQTCLVDVVLHVEQCRATTDRAFIAWVLAIAHTACRDLLRREGPVDNGLSSDVLERASVGSFEESVGRTEESSTGVEILLGVVGRISAELPDDLAALLWMRLVGGDEWAAIGEALGIPATAAKRRYQRAQRTMRRLVDRELDALPAYERGRARAWLAQHGDIVDAHARP